jgi:hypothetical protein
MDLKEDINKKAAGSFLSLAAAFSDKALKSILNWN